MHSLGVGVKEGVVPLTGLIVQTDLSWLNADHRLLSAFASTSTTGPSGDGGMGVFSVWRKKDREVRAEAMTTLVIGTKSQE